MQNYIFQSLEEGIRLRNAILNDSVTIANIEKVGLLMADALQHGYRVLLCGNGGSAADAQHIAAELVGRFVTQRRGLPSIALTTDTSILTAVGNDYGYDYVFRRQVEALGNKGDIIIGISTSGNSTNVEHALSVAREMGLTTVGFLGRDGGRCLSLCDYAFVIPHAEAARVQEMHITLGHILCGIVDAQIAEQE